LWLHRIIKVLQTLTKRKGNNMGLSLAKGQALSLKKADGGALTRVTLGLGWDAKKKGGLFGALGGGGDIDLDASAILFDGGKRAVDTVYYGGLTSKDGSIRHSGDNLTGEGDGDDEQIVVDLNRVDSAVQSIVLVVTSYSGQKFSQIENAFCRVVDSSTGANEVVRYDLKESPNNTAMVMAKIVRSAGGWEFQAIGEPTDGKTPSQVVGAAQRFA
jgi:tellurium resistance protein TerZ